MVNEMKPKNVEGEQVLNWNNKKCIIFPSFKTVLKIDKNKIVSNTTAIITQNTVFKIQMITS
jgi:hypothetical protein